VTRIKLGTSTGIFKHKLQAEYFLLTKKDENKIYKVIDEPPGYWSVICIGDKYPPAAREKIKANDNFSQQRYESSNYQKIIDQNSRLTSSVFCHRCGGDGGALGNCPRCGGNGLEPQ
jgi:hypothetical protein